MNQHEPLVRPLSRVIKIALNSAPSGKRRAFHGGQESENGPCRPKRGEKDSEIPPALHFRNNAILLDIADADPPHVRVHLRRGSAPITMDELLIVSSTSEARNRAQRFAQDVVSSDERSQKIVTLVVESLRRLDHKG